MSSLLVVSSTAVGCRKGGRPDVGSKFKVPSSVPKSSGSRSSAARATLEPRAHEGLNLGLVSDNSAKLSPVFGALVSSAAAAALMFGSAPAYAADTLASAATFTKTCAGCHSAGGRDGPA